MMIEAELQQMQRSREEMGNRTTIVGENLTKIKIIIGVFQGDSLPPLIFRMTQLTNVLREAKPGYLAKEEKGNFCCLWMT